MNLDKYGLPVQDNGDAADQLQRVGMVAVGQKLTSEQLVNTDLEYALRWMLQKNTGEYRRYYETSVTDDVTGDQLIPVMAYWSLCKERKELRDMRWIFAQNVRKQGEPNVKTFPDFILFRTLPLIIRGYNIPIIVHYIIDVLLILAVICYNIFNRGLDDVDDNNLVITLAVCRVSHPTLFSYIASKLYTYTRAYSPEYAMRRYHRAEAGGNPEIGEQWIRIIRQYLH